MRFKRLFFVILIGFFLFFTGCAHQQPISGEPTPPVGSSTGVDTTGTGGGTVLKTYD